ncbi:MAG: insulinase family protein [Ruminococcaceae bacterium]|nr:insulinase family protein [Oscillospiraceae bacterium]
MNNIKRINLYPSVTLNVIPSEKFKISYLSVYFSRPADEKEAPKNALIPEILTRVCKKYPTMTALNTKLQSLYGASIDPVNMLMGEAHIFGLYSSFPENRYAFDDTDILGEIVDLISELLKNPLIDEKGTFYESIVESEKTKLCGRIKACINNPASYSVRRCEEIMCADERFSVSPSGTIESVSSVNAKELYEYYTKLPGGTAVDIYYAGSADASLLISKFKEIFRNFDTSASVKIETEIRRSAPSEIKTVIEEQPVAQGKLAIGLRSGYALSDEDYHVFALLNSILGSSPTSKLFMNVREKMSLCYYCSSRPNALKGIMTIASGIEVDNFEKAKNAVLEQLEFLKNGNISDFEIDSAKKSLVNAYRELTDSPSGLVSWYLTRSFADRNDSPEEVAEKILSVTKEELVESASRLSVDTVYFLKGTLSPEGVDEDEEDDE